MEGGVLRPVVRFDNGLTALTVRVSAITDLGPALTLLGLHTPRRTVVLVGGAAGLLHGQSERLRPLFQGGLAPALQRLSAVCIDGGTDSGVMAMIGSAKAMIKADFPLVGVAAIGTTSGHADSSDLTAGHDLEPHHTHFVLVPGSKWGAESPWIARAATALAGSAPSVTVLVNGGELAFDDVRHSVEGGRPVIVVSGSGRTANELDAALSGKLLSGRAARLAGSGLLRVVRADDPASLDAMLMRLLSTEEAAPGPAARDEGRHHD